METNCKPVFVLISPKNRTAYNFRGELLLEIKKAGYAVYVTGPNRIDVEKIEALGATFCEIPNDKNGINVLSDLRYLLSLYRLFKKLKPRITLGYTIKPVIYGSIAAWMAKVLSINSMITGAGYLFISTSFKAKVLKIIAFNLYKLGLKASGNVIFQNKDDREEFINHGLVKKEKTYIVNGSGVNMEKFKLEPLPEKITFFMLSRAMYSKGVREYLQAAEIVKKQYPDVRFMLLGAVENLQDSMKQSEIDGYISKGIIDYFGETSDVARYYAMTSVYVLPSYREGTPRTALEAMAVGRPVITTDTPGCRETVIDNVTGFLVPVKEVNKLTEKMIWFIEHPKEIFNMGIASYNFCKEKFDVEKVNQQMYNILQISFN